MLKNKNIIKDNLRKTKKTYGFLWARDKNIFPVEKWHFNSVQETVGEPLVRGQMGIDVGSGCGYDTYIMAKDNPAVSIVSIDVSDGVYKTQDLTAGLDNVRILKCSALDISIKDSIFDFAYCYGVLHHTTDPKRGLMEISRILKKNSPAFLYLYEDHSDNIVKYIAIKIVTMLRNVTVKMPPAIFYILSCVFSPFVFVLFSLPAKILKKIKTTRHLADKIPFNFGQGPFSLRGDLYDRFTAPIEHRFSRQGVYNIFTECGFKDIDITRLKDRAGWVAWGYKR